MSIPSDRIEIRVASSFRPLALPEKRFFFFVVCFFFFVFYFFFFFFFFIFVVYLCEYYFLGFGVFWYWVLIDNGGFFVLVFWERVLWVCWGMGLFLFCWVCFFFWGCVVVVFVSA